MNVEIVNVANGYLVKPRYDYCGRGETYDDKLVWVFSDYRSMMDKLQEILQRPEQLNDSPLRRS